jgi:TrmH family RNA methyltransferase
VTEPTGARISHVASRDNAALKLARRLSRDSLAYRKLGQIWLEGDHLCRAARDQGVVPAVAVFAASAWQGDAAAWALGPARVVIVPDTLFDDISALGSPGRMGFIIDQPEDAGLRPGVASVLLDRVQDAGNVGSILRSAAALGFGQVLALKGSAALWSPKVLRAGMGAHFGLHLVEGLEPSALARLELPVIATSSHRGQALHTCALPWPCVWAFGHEGQGLADAVAQQARLWCRIGQPGGQESLNVAAAAAICLHASAVGRPAGRA